jgi:propionyl-CoA carboxylase alpha chain
MIRIFQQEDAEITFIGPSSQVLAVMGDKLASKEMARKAGVNVIPGCEDIITSADMCVEAAATLGYPVMIKALSGGGGKGMRVAHTDQEAR